jgi:hypothetical protein
LLLSLETALPPEAAIVAHLRAVLAHLREQGFWQSRNPDGEDGK